MEVLVSVVSSLLSSSLVYFLVQRYFNRKDKREEEQKRANQDFYTRANTSLETVRLLAYYRMSEEIESLLNKGYATPVERRVLEEMYKNYKNHDWNGDMDARLERVRHLRTNPPHSKEVPHHG